MDQTSAQLYRIDPGTALRRVESALTAGLSGTAPGLPVPVFFRADDIGVISGNFINLIDVFQKHDMPLCLAVVPVWITRARWETISRYTDASRSLWCWHQHGWSHANHETSGKKCEFGQARPDESVAANLVRGKEKLETIIGQDFSPFFTPPWNRCSNTTLELLAELKFHGISRSRGEQNFPAPLPDIFINVDLHTRKEPEPDASLDALCTEFERAVKDTHIGIMIHHQRMNANAFSFLSGLLEIFSRHPQLQPVDFNAFLNKNE